MFNPSREQVRDFFMTVWRKRQQSVQCAPLENMALAAILWHPEYVALLENTDNLTQHYADGDLHANPFLHLSMHLAINEQLSIDQPPGIVAVYQALSQNLNSEHAAAHVVMTCLAEVVWHAQQTGQMPDSQVYLDKLRQQL